MSAASKNTFFGRERELLQLQQLRSTVKDKSISRFVVVSGRRRVGKTRLILEALPSCDDMPSVYVYINPHLDAGSNLEDFSESLRECLGWSRPRRFHDFEDALMEVFEVAKQRPITLVLDEFQNFGRVEPSFYGTLLLHDSIKYPPIDNRNDPPRLSKEVLSHAKKKEDHGLRCVQQWRIKNHDQTRRKSEDPAPGTR